MIDITITATFRPELLKITLDSFCERLFYGPNGLDKSDYRVIINIDPVGATTNLTDDVISVCMDHFDNVISKSPEKPHFPTAFIWCWKQVTAPYVFHLEEDWELLHPIHMQDMISTLDWFQMSHLRLSTWRSETQLKQWKWLCDHNGLYYEIPQDVTGTIGFCGHPSLNSKWFVQTCLKHMSPDRNPEKQIKWRNKELWEHLHDKPFGLFQETDSPAAIKDIGRKWMVKHGFKKKGNRAWFTEWEAG